MGNTSSQPEPFPEIPDDFGDIVPETPHPSHGADKKKTKNKKPPSSISEALSPIANGTRRSPKPDSSSSKPSKRKRGSEHELKQKPKKHRKSTDEIGGEPASQEDNLTSSAVPAQSPSDPNQARPSNSRLSRGKQPQKNRRAASEIGNESEMKEDNLTSAQKVSIQSLLGPSQSSPSKPQQKSRKKPNKNGKDTEIPPSTTPDPKRKVKVAENQTGSPSPEDSEDPVVRSKGTRGSRTRKTDNLKIGFYTADEVRKIEAYKVNFCTLHGVSSTTFDEMVQHSERTTTGDFPVSSEVITKAEFWKEIYGLVPDRDRRSVYRFMRRHFQASAQKAHDWSKEQEEELIDLVAQHGPKWTYIGKLIGRSDDDVTQRWKNKLEHQATMRQGAWSEEETRTFLNAVESSWQTMKPMFPERAGKDLYEVDERLIIWGNISKEMEHTRSRQQCADKWRKIVRQVMTMRANGQPDAVYDPRLAAKKAANWNTRLENQRKSSQFVDDSDGDEIMNTGVASPLPESQDVIGTTSASGGSVASDHEVQSQEDEVDLPEPPKKTKNSNSKRKRTEEPTAATETKEMSSPVASKTDKKEKKREKKERQEKLNREKELEDQMEEEAKEKEEKAARKVNKRKRKQEKRKRREEEERLAAEASSSEAEVTAPPKKKKS